MPELTIRVRFLDDRYHGRGDGGRPEWPPSPMRLYQALLAGNAPLNDRQAEAFRWLEHQPPPIIRATPSQPGGARMVYVPSNNADTTSDPSKLRTGKLIQPMLLPPGRPIEFIWEYDTSHIGHARVIADAARRLHALGWGIDLVIGDGCLAGSAWQNDESADAIVHYAVASGNASSRLRVPVAGSLTSLIEAYKASLDRLDAQGVIRDQPGAIVYRQQAYSISPPRAFAAFSLIRDDGEFARIPPGRIKALVGMLRAAASSSDIRQALGDEVVDRQILGHPPDHDGPRVSFLPLTTIGHSHSDGRIRRVAIASCPADRVLIETLARMLHGQALVPSHSVAAEATITRTDEADPVVRRYVSASRHWASTTPILLPGYDDRKAHRGNHRRRLERAEKLVFKALAHAGIDFPCRVALHRVPYWAGTEHARQFNPRDKLAHYPRYHVRLTFDSPVVGPLAIGAGRHAGFGVMAAADEC